jgi:2-polyprenyl-6-methoxyphenol hydroxylase-like FAD-dependent oxidoreductase
MKAAPVGRVLVAGGGVGGLATAVALRKAGVQTAVFERADKPRPSGPGLHLWTNAVLALDDLGLAEALRAVAPVHEHCEFRNWRGEMLASWPLGLCTERYGQPTVAVERRALMGILTDGLGDQELHFGAELVGYEQDATGVTALFADGRQERGDVLIGADGIKSATRRQLLGDKPPRFNGYVAWRAAVDFEHERIPDGCFCIIYGHGTRFVYYDVAPGRLHWMSVANGAAGGVDNGGVRELLLARHQGWMEPVAQIIEATDEREIIRTDVIDRKPDKRWVDGRVALLGDAAHPMSFNTGQGACQAIEDALTLAHSLASTADVPTALRTYEAERRPRTARSQKAAWVLGRLAAVQNPLGVRLRDTLVRKYWERGVFARLDRDMATGARWRDNVVAEPA